MIDDGLGYRLLAAARQDLRDIWRYTRAQWGERQADGYLDGLAHAFLLLADNPKLGVSCGSILRRYRRKAVGRHVIYYRVEDGGIIVACVLHDRMLARPRLRKAERD